jgi:hypothetical protein
MLKGSVPLVLAILGTIAACAPPPKAPGQATPAQPGQQVVQQISEGVGEISSEFRELSRPGKVQAWVDNLIVKAQPGKEMPQVAVMQEGEIAEYLYQRTVRKSEITLRSQRYYEPWILIRTRDGVMGWVHEGAVKFVNAGLDGLLTSPSQPSTSPNARTRSVDAGPSPGAIARDFLLVPGKRAGQIQLNTSEADLATLYGAENVGRSTIKTPDKSPEPCTVLFPESKDEVRITWKDEDRTKVKAVYFEKSGGKWVTAQGLQPGISLAELTKINESPLVFYGFNWAYSGTVNSWKKGALSKYEKHFYVTLSPPKGVAIPPAFKGEKLLNSNAEGVDALGIKVERVVLYLD